MILSYVIHNKTNDFFFVENQNKGDNESENENPNRHSEYGQTKHYQQTLSSIDSFLLSLVMSSV